METVSGIDLATARLGAVAIPHVSGDDPGSVPDSSRISTRMMLQTQQNVIADMDLANDGDVIVLATAKFGGSCHPTCSRG
jgi:hypothetical protein